MFTLCELDKEQLSGLSNLGFDLAKGAFAVAVIPAASKNIFQSLIAVVIGLAFTYTALLFLKLKKNK